MFSNGGLGQGVSFLVAGLVLVPVLGERGSLLLGCIIFTLAPLLSWLCLVTNAPVSALAISYCLLSSLSFNVIVLATLTLPVTWFPDHRGKVVGFINCGVGLGTTGNFSQIPQTHLTPTLSICSSPISSGEPTQHCP